MESCGRFVKTRKNHAACCYGKYYIVHGGLDEEEKVVNEINWINLEGKKQRWKHLVVEGRFNHKMIVVERGGK